MRTGTEGTGWRGQDEDRDGGDRMTLGQERAGDRGQG